MDDILDWQYMIIHTIRFQCPCWKASISSNFAAVVVIIPAIAARMQHPKIAMIFFQQTSTLPVLSCFNRVLLVAIPILSDNISPIFMNSLVFRLYFSILKPAKRFSVTQILWWNSHSLSTKPLLYYYIMLCNVPTTQSPNHTWCFLPRDIFWSLTGGKNTWETWWIVMDPIYDAFPRGFFSLSIWIFRAFHKLNLNKIPNRHWQR